MEAELSGSTIFNTNQEDLLKSAKAKMGEVKEENERLKKLLSQIMKEYQSLENQISSMVQSKNDQSTETNSSISNNNNSIKEDNYDDNQVSLTLGNWSTTNKKHNYDHNYKKQENNDRKIEGELELGLDYCKASDNDPMKDLRFENSNGESNRDSKEGVNMEAWSSSHDLKAKENLKSKEGDDQESLHQPQVKKTRVCIRSRCDSPTIHDGCHWRKYGQKIAKGNPCPRAYYRCTVSQNCPVRKQVQRCPQDMSILITTYEGTHNHPLPLSATAMASATSAAAAMIKSPSLTSQTPTLTRPLNTSSLGLHSSNFITTFNNNPSLISTSSHNSHPTITLDLTLPNSGFSSFDWLSSSSNSSRNSSFLNFSSTPSSSSLPSLDFSKNNNSCSFPTNTSSWANGYLLPYNNTINNNNTNNNNNNIRNNNIFQNPNSSLNDTLAAAATKVIASNPNFQSVLAAAISSYVGNKNNNLEQKNGSQPIDQGDKSLTLFPPTSKNNASVGADASRGESRSGSA